MSKYLYILGNGHGINTYIKGLNPYRKSEIWKDGSQLFEYEFTRGIVKFLSFMLRQRKIDCEILVPELKDIPIKSGRAKRANDLAKSKECILVSIHGNWFKDPNVHGFETHYVSEKGKEIADIFQKHIGKLGRNRGIKKSGYAILKYPKCISILTENGFYSNEAECKKMLTTDFQYKIAEQHLKAIQEIETKT